MTAPDPFSALGLSPSDLTDQQVRDAWRTIATTTHPDRADGGNPERYARASAAYEELRTPFGRGEALADLRDTSPARYGPLPPPAATTPATATTTATITAAIRTFPRRLRHGRPARITARALTAALAAWGAVTLTPGTPAVALGCALWFILTSRHDLAPPPGR